MLIMKIESIASYDFSKFLISLECQSPDFGPWSESSDDHFIKFCKWISCCYFCIRVMRLDNEFIKLMVPLWSCCYVCLMHDRNGKWILCENSTLTIWYFGNKWGLFVKHSFVNFMLEAMTLYMYFSLFVWLCQHGPWWISSY